MIYFLIHMYYNINNIKIINDDDAMNNDDNLTKPQIYLEKSSEITNEKSVKQSNKPKNKNKRKKTSDHWNMNEFDNINAFISLKKSKNILKQMYKKTAVMTIKTIKKTDNIKRICGYLEFELENENSPSENSHLLNLFNIRPSHYKEMSINPNLVNHEQIKNKNNKFCNFFYRDYNRMKEKLKKDDECDKKILNKISKTTNMVFVFMMIVYLFQV